MPRNYDTTGHKAYTRVERIEINYPSSGIPEIQYVERDAYVDPAGAVRFLDGAVARYTMAINPPGMLDRIPVVNPRDGVAVEGASTSLRELLLGMTAVIRADQLRRDAEAAQAAADAAAAQAVQAAQAAQAAADAANVGTTGL